MARDNYRNSRTDEELRKFSPTIHAATQISKLDRLSQDSKLFRFFDFAGIGAGSSVQFLLRSPPDNTMHLTEFRVGFEGGSVSILLYENTVVSNPGIQLSTICTNRDVLGVAESSVYANPVVTNNGTQVISAAVFPSNSTVDYTTAGEIILKRNTDHLFILRNDGTSSLEYSFTLGFYEPTYEA